MDVCWRTVDDLQYFTGRGLVLECFLSFVEQARILDRNDRLVSESLEQTHLSLWNQAWGRKGAKRSEERRVGKECRL